MFLGLLHYNYSGKRGLNMYSNQCARQLNLMQMLARSRGCLCVCKCVNGFRMCVLCVCVVCAGVCVVFERCVYE